MTDLQRYILRSSTCSICTRCRLYCFYKFVLRSMFKDVDLTHKVGWICVALDNHCNIWINAASTIIIGVLLYSLYSVLRTPVLHQNPKIPNNTVGYSKSTQNSRTAEQTNKQIHQIEMHKVCWYMEIIIKQSTIDICC